MEVPLDLVTKHRRQEGLVARLLLQLDKKRVCRGPVDINFSKENLGKSLLDGEVFHFSVGARLLGAELIAGKAKHSELVGADQRRQLGEFSIVGIG